MSPRVKCKECLSCMNAVWVDNTRYWHCWLCKTYYAGRNDELVLVEDPNKNKNKPIKVEEQDVDIHHVDNV